MHGQNHIKLILAFWTLKRKSAERFYSAIANFWYATLWWV